MSDEVCSVNGCDRARKARGYCGAHYHRLQRYGDPGAGQPMRARGGRPCSVNGCGRLAVSRSWCATHYGRWKRTGDPLGLRQAPHGSGWIDSAGYRVKRVSGRTVREHRLAMEGVLGRRLHDDEHVHHRNGDRLDNSPANLELWVTTCGSGRTNARRAPR